MLPNHLGAWHKFLLQSEGEANGLDAVPSSADIINSSNGDSAATGDQ